MKKVHAIWLGVLSALSISLLLMTIAVVGVNRPQPNITIIPMDPVSDAPLPEPDPIDLYMAQMSPDEKVWQMLYVFPEQLGLSKTCCKLTEWKDALEAYPVGGIVVNAGNMNTTSQLRKMLNYAKLASDITPFIGVDEEGGNVSRIAYKLKQTTAFEPMYSYRKTGPSTAFNNAKTIGQDIAALGLNQNFAPVADVWTNPENTIIGTRAYSDDPDDAAQLVSAAVEGLHSAGIIPTLKHFPGHGDTLEDSHLTFAHSKKTMSQLTNCELKPFAAGIDAGAGMVMVGHITLDKIDPGTPATLSSAIVTDLLRDDMGWDGVVITDSFTMAAISANYDEGDAAVMAIEAGCDIILGAVDPQGVAKAILHSVSSQRIDESVRRILQLKSDYGLISFE